MAQEFNSALKQRAFINVQFQFGRLKSVKYSLQSMQMRVKVSGKDDNIVQVYKTALVCQPAQCQIH